MWRRLGESHMRGRLGGRGGPSHHPVRLPRTVLLLLAEGSVVPIPVLLPNREGK